MSTKTLRKQGLLGPDEVKGEWDLSAVKRSDIVEPSTDHNVYANLLEGLAEDCDLLEIQVEDTVREMNNLLVREFGPGCLVEGQPKHVRPSRVPTGMNMTSSKEDMLDYEREMSGAAGTTRLFEKWIANTASMQAENAIAESELNKMSRSMDKKYDCTKKQMDNSLEQLIANSIKSVARG